MERNIKSFLSLMLAFVMVFGLIPANVFATGAELAAAAPAVEITADGGNVAKIGDAEYATLAEAIAAVQNGDTILLLADVAGDVTITQKKNVVFTIDGDGHTLTGAMTIEGTGYAGDQNQGLTIKNLKFIVGDYGIYAYKKNNYARNVTIDGCAFESAAGDTSGYGIAVRHVYNFTVKNTTGSGLFDFFYAGGAIDRLNVENVTVTDTQNAFYMAYGTKLNFTNVTTSNVDYGISIKNQTNNGTATITDCNLSGGTAVLLIVANPANTYNLIFKGNTLVDSEDWLVVADNDGNPITDEESNPFNVQKNGDEDAEEDVTIVIPVPNVAEVNGVGYTTLTDAIAAANSGDTITFLADITEDVTLNKSVTIDGADFSYTGKMSVTATASITLQNLNFVAGCVDKASGSGSVTVKNCDFDGQGLKVYALNLRTGSKNIVIEDCTAKGYGYGFLQTPKASGQIVVKNVEISDVNYGFKIDYSNGVTMENVTVMDAAYYGIYDSNYAAKTYNIKNSNINAIEIWERSGKTFSTTFNFEGANTVGALDASQFAKYVLVEENATLTAPAGFDVTTTVEGLDVLYEDGTYKLGIKKVYVAQIGEQGYETLAAAIDAANAGDTITFLTDITEDVTVNKNVTIDGADFSYTGKMTVNNNLTVTVQNVNFVNGCIDKVKGTKGTLTVKDCTFDGTGSDYYYAVTMRGGAKVVTENCQSKGFVYGFLYTPSAVTNVSVKNVAVTECGMGINITYGSKITLENVTMTDVGYGIQSHNYGAKTFTMTNCDISGEKAIFAWERTENAVVDTFVFQGTGNKLSGEVVTNGHAVLKLADIDATLTAPEGLTVTTDAGEQYKVIYEEGVYKVALRVYVAEVNGEIFESIQEAVNAANDGDTILVIADHEIACDAEILINVVGKDITIDLNGKAVTVNADAEQAARVVFRTEADAKLTIQDSVGTGSVIANGEGVLHYMFRNEGEMIVKSGSYELSALTGGAMFFSTNSNMLVEGGNFKQTTEGWMFNAIGNGTNVITAVGGTFNRYFIGGEAFNENKWNEVVIPSIYALSDNGDGTWTITAAVCYNTNTGFGYASLNEAAAAAKDGENIVLLADIAESVVIDGKSISLELNRMYMTGEITLASADAALTAAKDLNVVTSVADAKVVYENGTYMVKLLQYVAQIGENKYDDLSDALAAAKSGETVQVIANTAEFLVMVPAEVKLDLNGFVVTAKNVLAFGIVMDTAAEVGGIKISNDTTKAFTKLQPENGGYLPIYDTRDGMYKFFEHEVVAVDVVAGEDDAKFRFQLRFEDKAAYEVLANTADSDVSYVLNLMWTGMEDYTVRYRMTDATVRAYAASVYEQMSDAENPENTRKMTLTIYGVNALGTGGYVSAVPSVETVAEVTSTADMLRHENP